MKLPVSVNKSPKRKIASSPTYTKSTDIRSFFGGGGLGKENRDPAKATAKQTQVEKKTIVRTEGKEKEVVANPEKVKPEKKKRKVEHQDEDFVMMADSDEDEEPEDAVDSDAEDGDAQVEGDGDDDLESDHESSGSEAIFFSLQS
jgi:hypothetical protein